MRFSFPVFIVLCLPLAAWAQNHSNAPLIAVGNGAVIAPIPSAEPAAAPADAAEPPATPFPATAVTVINRNASGQQIVLPPSPTATPKPPEPTAPVSKRWPADTVSIFMQSCMHFHVEFGAACRCIIDDVMAQMPHDEFLRLSDAGTIEEDPRYITIRQHCIGTPRQRSN